MNEFIHQISQEAINTFEDDYIVESLVNTVSIIRDEYTAGNGSKKPTLLRKNKVIDRQLDKLEDDLYKRFGLNMRVVGGDTLAYVFPNASTENDTTKPFRKYEYPEWIKTFKDAIEKYKGINLKDINFGDEYDQILGKTLSDAKMMKEAMLQNGKDIKVDFNKAHISGIPRDITAGVLGVSFLTMFKMGLSDREITAVIMHEIGHAFTHIQYVNQFAVNSITIAESLYDDPKNGDKYITDFSKTVLNSDISTSKEFIYRFMRGDLIKTNDWYKDINSEALADQFATRFGLGKDIVTALSKFDVYAINNGSKKSSTNSEIWNKIRNGFDSELSTTDIVLMYLELVVLVLSLIVGILTILYYTAGISMFLYNILWLASITNIFLMVIKLIINAYQVIGTDSQDYTLSIQNIIDGTIIDTYTPGHIYDSRTQRYKRVKMDIIRQIRQNKISNSILDKYLKDIKEIDNVLSYYDSNKTFADTVGFIFDGVAKQVGAAEFFMRIEELTENDLHVRALVFKKLKRG